MIGELSPTFTPVGEADPEPGATDGQVRPAALSDPDSWCEMGTACRENDGEYLSQVKGNAAYGDQNGVIGAVDFILRANLNGRQANFTIRIFNDYGPAINPFFIVNCREDNFGPDSDCGEFIDDPGSIFATYSSSSIYGNRLQDASDYFATLNGQFTASGHPQTFFMGELRTNSWNCPTLNRNCRF